MTAWAHLLNAEHIDHVLAVLEHNAPIATPYIAWRMANTKKWEVAREASKDVIYRTGKGEIWNDAWAATGDASRRPVGEENDLAEDAAEDAIMALIAYDEAGEQISRPPEVLNGLYQLTGHPMFLLLQPFLIIYPGDISNGFHQHH